jgi:hypothetical protein
MPIIGGDADDLTTARQPERRRAGSSLAQFGAVAMALASLQ